MAKEIFLSYRHSDATGFTEALYAYLQHTIGADHLFRDRQNIDLGYRIPEVVRQHLDRCIVLLAIIGRGWLTAADEAGRRRLDDPNDPVRVEILSALHQGKRVIPVLVDSAQMPRENELPDVMKTFAECRAVTLSSEQFAADAQALAFTLRKEIMKCEGGRLEITDLSSDQISDLRAMSNEGDADAQNALGLIYSNGSDIIAADYAEAIRLYRLAAAQGHIAAQFNLGGMYVVGRGVLENPQETARLLKPLADQGFAPAQCYLGRMYFSGKGVTTDLVKGLHYIRLAANQGYAASQVDLGAIYSGGYGVKLDVVEAVRLYRSAAEQGNAAAQYALAICYELGRGVAKDDPEAVRLYRLSADQRFPFALSELATRYRKGKGVPKNLAKQSGLPALQWRRVTTLLH